MSDELTSWFDGNIDPVHVGVYERDFNSGRLLALWDGRQWMLGSTKVDEAAAAIFPSLNLRGYPWRGLANEPKVKP